MGLEVVQESKDMMAAMEDEFQKFLNEQRQDFESTREELKVEIYFLHNNERITT
jgi:hypothetical protein